MKNSGVGVEAEAGVPARQRLLREIMTDAPITVAELAQRLGVSAAGVRRQIDLLVEAGLITDRPATQHGPRGRGRPAKAYLVTEAGRAEFCHSYDELALDALNDLVAAVGRDAVTRLGERRVQQVEARVADLRAEDPTLSPMVALSVVLNTAGYVTSVSSAPHGEQLCQHHCPVAQVAAQYPELCEVETKVFAKLLGSHVQRLATIAHGDAVCTTSVPSPTYDSAVPTHSQNSSPQLGAMHNDQKAVNS